MLVYFIECCLSSETCCFGSQYCCFERYPGDLVALQINFFIGFPFLLLYHKCALLDAASCTFSKCKHNLFTKTSQVTFQWKKITVVHINPPYLTYDVSYYRSAFRAGLHNNQCVNLSGSQNSCHIMLTCMAGNRCFSNTGSISLGNSTFLCWIIT